MSTFGPYRADVSRERRPFPRSMMRGRLRGNPTLRSLTKVGPGESAIEALDFVDQDGGRYVLGTAPAFRCDDEICLLGVDFEAPWSSEQGRHHRFAEPDADRDARWGLRKSSGEIIVKPAFKAPKRDGCGSGPIIQIETAIGACDSASEHVGRNIFKRVQDGKRPHRCPHIGSSDRSRDHRKTIEKRKQSEKSHGSDHREHRNDEQYVSNSVVKRGMLNDDESDRQDRCRPNNQMAP